MLTLLLTLTLAAANPPFLYEDPLADQTIRHAMQATYDLDLDTARREAQALQTRYPDHPTGYLLMTETYWWEAQSDPQNKNLENAYYRAQELTVNKAQSALKFNKYPVGEITATLASAYGSYARFQLTQGKSTLSALRAGLTAHDYADKVYHQDPNYYDIWVGIGAFNYFTGALPSILKPFAWLIGAHGDSRLGLEQLRTAMDRARYARTEAQIVYYTVLLEDAQYAEALRVLEKLMADHPDNFVLYGWVTDWHREQSKDGADYFERLSQTQIKRSPRMAQYALLEKAAMQAEMRRPADARQTLVRLKGVGAMDGGLAKRVQAMEKTLPK